jgi:hypothetical protein
MMSACVSQAPVLDSTREAEAAQRAVAALPPECTLGASVQGVAGPSQRSVWRVTLKAVRGPSSAIPYVYAFDKPVPARGWRVALNRHSLQKLEKVETRDAAGDWHDAGPLLRVDAPAACAFVWLEHALPDTRQMNGLRLSFHRDAGTFMAVNPAVLRASAN